MCHINDTVRARDAIAGYSIDDILFNILDARAEDDRVSISDNPTWVGPPYWKEYRMVDETKYDLVEQWGIVFHEGTTGRGCAEGGYRYGTEHIESRPRRFTPSQAAPGMWLLSRCFRALYLIERTGKAPSTLKLPPRGLLTSQGTMGLVLPRPFQFDLQNDDGTIYHLGAPEEMKSCPYGFDGDSARFMWTEPNKVPYDIRFSVLGTGETNGYHTHEYQNQTAGPGQSKHTAACFRSRGRLPSTEVRHLHTTLSDTFDCSRP